MNSKKIDKKYLKFIPPDTIESALDFLSSLNMILTLWVNTKGKVPLLFWVTDLMKDKNFHFLLENHVQLVTDDGSFSLFDLDKNLVDNYLELTTEAIFVFCDGLLRTDIPKKYGSRLAGFDFKAMVAELENVIKDIESLQDKNILGHMLGKSNFEALKKTLMGG